MNRKNDRIETKFALENRFALIAAPAAPFRALQETELERLKTRLLQQALRDSTDSELSAPLRRAANDAAALAWATWYPLLLFPLLFEEKAQEATRQTARQAAIRQRSLGVSGRGAQLREMINGE